MNFQEYKQKVFAERPDVKREYEKLGEPMELGALVGASCKPVLVEVRVAGGDLELFGTGTVRESPSATDTDVGVKNLTGCPYCKPDADGWVKVFGAYSIHNGMLETGHCKPQKIMYCPHCGAPLNDEARTMLDKRLRG